MALEVGKVAFCSTVQQSTAPSAAHSCVVCNGPPEPAAQVLSHSTARMPKSQGQTPLRKPEALGEKHFEGVRASGLTLEKAVLRQAVASCPPRDGLVP